MNSEGRVLGIDLGERRIGIALSDPTRTLAQPLPTLKRRARKRMPVKTIVDLIEEHEVTEVVLGLPLSLSGEENEWCGVVRETGDKIAERSSRPVHYIDERMTSVRAERAVRTKTGLPKHKREEKERVDAAAAVLILQSWLDRQSDDE